VAVSCVARKGTTPTSESSATMAEWRSKVGVPGRRGGDEDEKREELEHRCPHGEREKESVTREHVVMVVTHSWNHLEGLCLLLSLTVHVTV
jgi:hypothetical protein